MAEITIDVTDQEGSFSVENTAGFDLMIVGFGLRIELTDEQAEQLLFALTPYFRDGDQDER